MTAPTVAVSFHAENGTNHHMDADAAQLTLIHMGWTHGMLLAGRRFKPTSFKPIVSPDGTSFLEVSGRYED